MQKVATPIANVIDALSRLPGIGPKTAARLAYYMLRAPEEEVFVLADALRELRERTVFCERCHNIAETSPCAICTSEERDRSVICVVEEPSDVLAIERTRAYRGVYHVLHGAISPVDGVGPEQLRVAELLARLQVEPVDEVLLATNPNLEGEATAMYLAHLIGPLGIRVTRLAHGLPVGGDLEYADEMTLSRALEGRREM
ncbi:MAG: recombination mediator RecR [Chloroflexota bacterium]|nr:recombination mediator RecR [Chloroflexota bacterium]